MAKFDFAKLKAMAQEILDWQPEEEGKNPDLPKPIDNSSDATEWGQADSQSNDSDQSDVLDFLGNELNTGKSSSASDDDEKKKKKSSMAMMAATLSKSMKE